MIFMLFPLFEGCDMLFSYPQLYSAAFYFLRSTQWEPAIKKQFHLIFQWRLGIVNLGTYGTHRLTLCVKETSRADDFYAPFRFLKVVICSSVLLSYHFAAFYFQCSILHGSLHLWRPIYPASGFASVRKLEGRTFFDNMLPHSVGNFWRTTWGFCSGGHIALDTY